MNGLKCSPIEKVTYPMQEFIQNEKAVGVVLGISALIALILANAGVSLLDMEWEMLFSTQVALGLLAGKTIGVVSYTGLCVQLKIASFPLGMNLKNLLGLDFLAYIGSAMSLFITQLASAQEVHQARARTGIFIASITGGITGYIVLGRKNKSIA